MPPQRLSGVIHFGPGASAEAPGRCPSSWRGHLRLSTTAYTDLIGLNAYTGLREGMGAGGPRFTSCSTAIGGCAAFDGRTLTGFSQFGV